MARILLSYIHYPVSAPKFFKRALRNLGYEVISLGPDSKGTLPWQKGEVYPGYADAPDIGLEYPSPATYPMKEALAKSGAVDLVIQMDANFHLVGEAPVPNIVYLIDNHVSDYAPSAENADRLFGAHSWGYWSDDPRFQWLPCAYSPENHFTTNENNRQLDLLLCGVVYPSRIALLNSLAPLGKVGVGMGVLGNEYNAAYNSARMALCLSVSGDLPMRVFENAAQGCLIFCDRQPDLDKLGLKDGEHYVGFSSGEEAVSRFKELMADPDLVSRIARQGRSALRNETWEKRAEHMLALL